MSETSYQEMLESAGLDNPPSAQGLKKGDLVVMHSCITAEYSYGVLWECETDSVDGYVSLIGYPRPLPLSKLQLVKS